MFWRKKTDGFEWHKYVRTTIKLRREDRRRRIDGVKDAAVAGLKGARRAGIEGSAAGLDRLNWAFAAPFVRLGQGIAAALNGIARLLERPLAPVADVMARQGVAPLLGLVALVAGLLGLGRAGVEGFDRTTVIELGVSLALFTLLFLPPLVTGRGIPVLAGLPRRLEAFGRRIPGLSLLSAPVLRTVTASLLAAGLIGAGFLGMRAVGQMPTITAFGGLPGLTSRPPLEGRASALAGDLLRVNSRVVRLSGIEAPEHDQQCGGQGKEKRWACGSAARTALQEMLRAKTVRCNLAGGADTGEQPGVCNIDGRDIAGDLVARGHVFAAAGLFSGYGRLEQDARNAKLGLWRGTVERPADYRARLWEVARKTAPDGCPIKGHVSAGTRHYVVPWSPNYARVKVEAQRGGRWFCSEQEAQAAGWRPVDRS